MILSEKMPSVSVKDVSQQEFTVALAAFLKKWVDSYIGWFYLTGPSLKMSLDKEAFDLNALTMAFCINAGSIPINFR